MKVALFTGPTGGHFYPALGFAEALKRRHPESQFLWVTSERGRFLVQKEKGSVAGGPEFLPDFPFPRPHRLSFFLAFLPFLLKLIWAFFKVHRRLRSFGPDLAVGFGSYVAFPGMVVSRWLGVPTLIHEQNRERGYANRWLARRADRVAMSFELPPGFESRPHWVVTGLPLRPRLVAWAREADREDAFRVSPGRVRILIFGGAQGASSLNRLWMDAVCLLSREEKAKLAVIHITGGKDLPAVEREYFQAKMEARTFSFYERIEEFYSQADLALTRAGAGTLWELALFGLPAVVVPYPRAESHQKTNANYFADEGAVRVLSEAEATPSRLKEMVLEFVENKTLRTRMAENLKRLARPEASERLVDLVESLLVPPETCQV